MMNMLLLLPFVVCWTEYEAYVNISLLPSQMT